MKNKSTYNTKRLSINLIFIMVLLAFSSINNAQETQKIPFYLPTHSSQLIFTLPLLIILLGLFNNTALPRY